MEYDQQRQEVLDLNTFSRLRLRIDLLASRLKAAVQDNPTGEIDLCPTLEECTTVAKEIDVYNPMVISKPTLRHYFQTLKVEAVYNVGQYFGRLQRVIKPQQLAWDIRVASLSREHLRLHKRYANDYNRRESVEKDLCYRLESLIYYLSLQWSPKSSLKMVLTSNSRMDSYHVLSLHVHPDEGLCYTNAVEGPGGDIYVGSYSSCHTHDLWSAPHIFIMYQNGSTSVASTSVSSPKITQESNAVGLQIAQHEERLGYLPHVPLGTSTSGYTAAPILTGGFTDNEIPSLHPFMQDRPPHTGTDSSVRQLPLTCQHEAVVVEPTEALQSSNTTIDMYGFAQVVSPYAPMTTVAQGLLPYNNRAGATPASLTSPEADSPWSETQGPPPPYALSPGIYQLRLQAATRPSPVADSPDPETPAPPYALSPRVFRRYGDEF